MHSLWLLRFACYIAHRWKDPSCKPAREANSVIESYPSCILDNDNVKVSFLTIGNQLWGGSKFPTCRFCKTKTKITIFTFLDFPSLPCPFPITAFFHCLLLSLCRGPLLFIEFHVSVVLCVCWCLCVVVLLLLYIVVCAYTALMRSYQGE
jgi:hypothetical protein